MGAHTMRLAWAMPMLVLGGCSLVLPIDRDYERDAAGVDGGLDGGRDGGVDGGRDGGADAGCSATAETSCRDDADNDCNGFTDCDDFACRASADCCAANTSNPWSGLGAYDAGGWSIDSLGMPTVSGTRVDFGAAFPAAIVGDACAPLSFGADFALEMAIDAPIAGHYAAFVLAPVSTHAPMTPFLSELTVRVTSDRRVRFERAGALVEELEMSGASAVILQIGLRPGFDDAGRGVLRATVKANGSMLVENLPVMPLSDLLGPGSCPDGDGLFVALEGVGTSVAVSSPLTVYLQECENPTQFYAVDETPTIAPPGGLIDAFAPGAWRAGGLAEPALVDFRTAATTERLELWCDAAAIERSDELVRPIDFTLAATARIDPAMGGAWSPRVRSTPPVETLFGPSAREPSVAVDVDASGIADADLFVVFAMRDSAMPDTYAIELARVSRANPVNVTSQTTLLSPSDTTECRSLRDPSIAVLGENPETAGLLLFYTCERTGMSASIGVARFAYAGGTPVLSASEDLLLDSTIGGYATRGAFSPEAIVTGSSAGPWVVRLWFLGRNGTGLVTLATARGQLEAGSATSLPKVDVYPANPTLFPDAPVLGGDCSLGCGLDGVGVARTTAPGRWASDPSYLFVVAQSRQTSTGVEHALIPIRQPRPLDE
ncbi:MAG: hypothetical protein AB7S26_34660 [Sandaracinaceae bacterium]